MTVVDHTNWSIMQRLGAHEAISNNADCSIFRLSRYKCQACNFYN